MLDLLIGLLALGWRVVLGVLLGLLFAWGACLVPSMTANCATFGGWLVGGGALLGLVFTVLSWRRDENVS